MNDLIKLIKFYFRSNVVSKSRYNQKPMTTSDFERVEQELTHQISPSNLGHFVAKSLQNTAGWSSGGIGKMYY